MDPLELNEPEKIGDFIVGKAPSFPFNPVL
jgi:hypothetical protein